MNLKTAFEKMFLEGGDWQSRVADWLQGKTLHFF